MTFVDAHQTAWDATGAPHALLGAAGAAASVLVQVLEGPRRVLPLLRLASANPHVVGVVVSETLDSPERAAAVLAARRVDRRVVGVRSRLGGTPPTAGTPHDEALALLAASAMPLDVALTVPADLERLHELGERHPALPLVVDGLGAPPVDGSRSARAAWRTRMSRVARNPQVHAKVSGVYPPIGRVDRRSVEGLRPFVDDALEIFGAQRLMFGSDAPLAATVVGPLHQAVVSLVEELDAADLQALLDGTALRFYGIPVRGDVAESNRREQRTAISRSQSIGA